MKIPGDGSPMPEFDNADDPANYLDRPAPREHRRLRRAVAGTEVKGETGAATNDPKALFAASCG